MSKNQHDIFELLRIAPKRSVAKIGLILFVISLLIDFTISISNAQVASNETSSGILSYQAGNYPDAIRLFQEVLQSDSRNFGARFYLGCAQYAQGSFKEAEANFAVCNKIDPAKSEAYFWLGRATEAQGKRAEAVAAYETVLALKPGDASAIDALRRLDTQLIPNAGWIGPFTHWQFYCLLIGASGMGYWIARKVIRFPSGARDAIGGIAIGVLGHEFGKYRGDRRLALMGGALAVGEMRHVIAIVTRQSRNLLLITIVVGTAASWTIICFTRALSINDAAWIIFAFVGGFLLYKERWSYL